MDICEYKDRLQTGTRHPWEVARARFIADLAGEYFRQENGPVRLLDFGCGDGFVIRTLARRYTLCHLVGVDQKIREINPFGEDGQESARIEYYENLEEYRGTDGSFDGALLLDVLEHIADDESFLQGFFSNRVFTGQARFVITCPAFRQLFSNDDILLGHFRRYSVPELRTKIERGGGVLLESGYIFFIPFVLRVIEVLLEKLGVLSRREKTHISTWRGGRLVTSIFSGILYQDALLCRCLSKLTVAGLTCYMICRKQVS